MAAGAAAGKFLQYESGAPTVAAQTAYGIEAEVEGYDAAFDPHAMTFMDFRRHHTGLWPSTAAKCEQGLLASHVVKDICCLSNAGSLATITFTDHRSFSALSCELCRESHILDK